MWTRRQLLGTGTVAVAGAALRPAPARAGVPPADLKFVFVTVYGGWDATRVFAAEFDNPVVDMESDATLGEVGDLRFVDHPARPSVADFFARWHTRTVILNGISVPSVGHFECVRLVMTGEGSGRYPDWAVRLASGASERYPLPHVVVRGPQFPGALGGLVTRIGTTGQAEALLSGDILDRSDLPLRRFGATAEGRMDDWLDARVARRLAEGREGGERAMLERHATALTRARTLESLVGQVRWDTDGSFATQVDLAVDLLAVGASRCVTVENETLEIWDSHADNDDKQSGNFEALFAGLAGLMEQLEATPGTSGATLADETVVVLLSEMGRTPQLNGGLGKDHWGHTSAMVVGPHLAGGRCVGGYSEYFYSEPVDFASGEVTEAGRTMTGGSLGATLLALGGVDPGEELPIDGILSP